MTKRKASTRSDGELTRQRILEAAGELFARQGLAETTNKAIAANAGVDLASINYHFGNRNGLYQHVLAQAHRHILSLDKLLQIAQSQQSAELKLKSFIRLLFTGALEQQDWHAQLLAREILSPTSHLTILVDEEIIPKMNIIKTIVSNVSGIEPTSPQLMPCLVNIVAPCLMLLVSHNRVPGPLQQIHQMPLDALVEQHFHFTLAGLKAIGQ